MANKLKTKREWLLLAKEQGFEWADECLSLCEHPNSKMMSLNATIRAAFVWAKTPQGHDYWANICRSLSKKEL